MHETPPDSEDGDYLNAFGSIPDYLDEVGIVPPDWHLKRRVGWLALPDGCRGADLGVLETLNTLREELASYLYARGYTDFDMSDLLSRDRELSQYISRHIYDQDYGALVYPSRLGAPSIGVPAKCWGIYERDPDGERPYTPLDTEAISRDDPDLARAAAIFALTL